MAPARPLFRFRDLLKPFLPELLPLPQLGLPLAPGIPFQPLLKPQNMAQPDAAPQGPTDLDVVIISLLPHRQCSPEDVQAGMAALVERVQAASGAHVLVANVCTYGASDDPGSNGTPSPRLQLRRLNLALMELSQNLGISILDVDRLMTELGAARTCPQPFHLSPAGAASVAEEAARVLADYGFFEDRPLVAQVAREAE